MCFYVKKKERKEYFRNALHKGTTSSKSFWDAVKPFITDKCKNNNDDLIVLEEEGRVINTPHEVAEILNNHYITIDENTCGKTPNNYKNMNSDNKIDDKGFVLFMRMRITLMLKLLTKI